MKKIITKFETRQNFFDLLKVNPGLIIVKFGATWCKPCQAISPVLEGFFATSPPNVLCADIDVDESFDLYSFLKSKKMVNGIPVILMYKKGNLNCVPNDSVTVADPKALDAFFRRCGKHLVDVERESIPKVKELNDVEKKVLEIEKKLELLEKRESEKNIKESA